MQVCIIIILYLWLYICYLHTKLQIMIEAQKSFPIMPDFISNLPKYFMPCTELFCRYICKSWWAITFLLFTTDRLYNFAWSNNSLLIILEGSIWFTVFFTVCRLCCEVFNIMTHRQKLVVLSILFWCLLLTKYFTQNCLLGNACCFILSFDQNHILLQCIALYCRWSESHWFYHVENCVATIKHANIACQGWL